MTPIARFAQWLFDRPSLHRCGYCNSSEQIFGVRVGRQWFCSDEHVNEQRLFWSAI